MSTDMFSVDKLVKCRMISGSANSGRGGSVRPMPRPATVRPSGTAGTSAAGNRVARRAGLESSTVQSNECYASVVSQCVADDDLALHASRLRAPVDGQFGQAIDLGSGSFFGHASPAAQSASSGYHGAERHADEIAGVDPLLNPSSTLPPGIADDELFE